MTETAFDVPRKKPVVPLEASEQTVQPQILRVRGRHSAHIMRRAQAEPVLARPAVGWGPQVRGEFGNSARAHPAFAGADVGARGSCRRLRLAGFAAIDGLAREVRARAPGLGRALQTSLHWSACGQRRVGVSLASRSGASAVPMECSRAKAGRGDPSQGHRASETVRPRLGARWPRNTGGSRRVAPAGRATCSWRVREIGQSSARDARSSRSKTPRTAKSRLAAQELRSSREMKEPVGHRPVPSALGTRAWPSGTHFAPTSPLERSGLQRSKIEP